MFPFRRILVTNLSGSVDVDLFRYGASVAALDPESKVVVAAPPGDRVVCWLVPAAQCVFRAHFQNDLGCRILTEPGLQDLFSEAASFGADLLLARYPQRFRGARQLARRLMEESPCPVWLVPEGANPRLRRVAAEMGPDDADPSVARLACALGRRAGAEELIAINVNFLEILDQGSETLERLRESRAADLMCRIARLDTGEMSCSVKVDHSPYVSRSLRRAADEENADLLVAACRPRRWSALQSGRSETAELACEARTAILTIRPPEPKEGPIDSLKRIMPLSEPICN